MQTPAEAVPARPGLKLHWSSPLFVLFRQLREGAVAIVGLLIAGSSASWEVMAIQVGLIAGAVLVLYAVVLVLTTRFWVEPDELVIHSGILLRRVRHLPFSRVQNVVISQHPVQRWFGVSLLKLESGGAQNADGQLQVIATAQARAIEAAVRRRHEGPVTAPTAMDVPLEAPAPLLRLPTGEVLKAGIVLERGFWLIIAALAGVYYGIDLPGLDPYAWLSQIFLWGVWLVGSFNTLSLALILLAVLLAVQVLTSLLSMLQALWLWHGFTLDRDGPRLRVECGLFNRRRSSALPDRIQVLRIWDGLWLRWLDRRVLGLDLVGGGGTDFQTERPLELLAPIVAADRAPTLCQEAVPGLDLAALDWQPVHASTHARLAKRAALLWTLPLAIALWRWPIAIVPVLIAAALAQVHAWAWSRYAAWAITPEFLAWRSGVTQRLTWIVPIARLDGCTIAESPFDRHHRTASLRPETQAPSTSWSLWLKFLPVEVAHTLARRVRSTTPLEHR